MLEMTGPLNWNSGAIQETGDLFMRIQKNC